MDAEITTLSSRGQIVIPQSIRDRLKLKEGEKFAVVGNEDTIILKKVKFSFDGFDEFRNNMAQWAEKNQIMESDVEEAIRKARKR